MRRYFNTNTNQALRDLSNTISRMPIDKANIGLRNAQAEGERLRTMAGLKRAEMELPGLQRKSQQEQAQLDIENSPFRIDQVLGNTKDDVLLKNGWGIRNTPDHGIMWVQSQKKINGEDVPPAAVQALDNIQRYYGYKPNANGELVDKDGKILPNYKAGPVVEEFRRIKDLNLDPLKARDNRISLLQSALESGKVSDKDAARINQEIDALKNTPEVDLREAYLSRLNQWKARDEKYGRQSKLMEPMIQEQVQKIAELKGAAAKAGDRQFELDKIDRKTAGDMAVAAMKKEDKVDPFVKKRREGMAEALNNIDVMLANKTRVDESGATVPLGNLEVGRLMLAKHDLENEVRRQNGEKPAKLFGSADDVKSWYKSGLITEDEAIDFIEKNKWNVAKKPAPEPEVKPAQPDGPPENTEARSTSDVDAFFKSDAANRPGWEALISKKTKDEIEAAKKKRKERNKKSFVRTPPKQ